MTATEPSNQAPVSLRQPLIDAASVLARRADYVIVDCRFNLAEPDAGQRAWQDARIPGAAYAHLDADLSGPIEPGRTGRHPLPDADVMRQRWAELGVDPQAPVVFYDDTGGPYAARAWWLACWLGHPHAQVLNGGLGAWQRAGGELDSATPATPAVAAPWPVREALLTAVTAAEVTAVLERPEVRLLDARARERFEGHVEPIDAIAGHIPGAHCAPFTDSLDSAGELKERSALTALWQPRLGSAERVVCYCGSGVTAAHQVLAITAAGLTPPALYPGSWSEWITRTERPIATGPELP